MVGVIIEFAVIQNLAQARIFVIQLLAQGLQVGQCCVQRVDGRVKRHLLERGREIGQVAGCTSQIIGDAVHIIHHARHTAVQVVQELGELQSTELQLTGDGVHPGQGGCQRRIAGQAVEIADDGVHLGQHACHLRQDMVGHLVHDAGHIGRGNIAARLHGRSRAQVEHHRSTSHKPRHHINGTALGHFHVGHHSQHDRELVLFVIILDFSHLTHLEAVHSDGGRFEQAIHILHLGVEIVSRFQQVNTFQVVNAPIEQNKSQEHSERYLDILIEKLTVPKMVIYPKIVNNQFLDTIVSFDPYDIYYGDDEAINGTFDSGSNFNRTLTMKSDSESADLSVEESENFTSNFTKPAVGLHKLSITNVDEFGNVYTIINTLDKQFTVTGINKVNISVDNVTNPTHAVAIVTADVDGTYTIRISPVSSTGNGLLFASGSTFTVNVKNGQGSQDLGALDAGKYTATASGEFDYYITEPGSTDFTVFENPNPDSNSTNPDDEPANENETSSNSTTSDDTETPAVDVISGDNQTQPEQMDNAEAKTLPATGNPILVAILAIFISLTSFRRRKI